MTRLTIAQAGDTLTFRPVTSSIVRRTKDGDVNVVILLFGTHYNISMNGILQETSEGDIDHDTQDIYTVNHELQLDCKQIDTAITPAVLQGTFSSFMYFYPGLRIKGHLKLSEDAHILPVPLLRGRYVFTDLLNKDQLIFQLVLAQNNLVFSVIEVIGGDEKVIYTEDLPDGINDYYFEFSFLVNGKSRLFKFLNWETPMQTKTRVWLGDVKAALGECNVAITNENDTNVLKTVSSDIFMLEYPQIFLKFDRNSEQRFIGRIMMFDTVVSGDANEDNWMDVRSRDYNFSGDRVIENGIVRIIIRSLNPVIEVYGWNYNAVEPSWELTQTLMTDADNGARSLKLQNITFEYFNKLQIKIDVNFGTSLYSIIMSRGDPYVTMLNKIKKKQTIVTHNNRLGADFAETDNKYNLANTFERGHNDALSASVVLTLNNPTAGFGFAVNGIPFVYYASGRSNISFQNITLGATVEETAINTANHINLAPDIGIISGISFNAVAENNTVIISTNTRGLATNRIATRTFQPGRVTFSSPTFIGGLDEKEIDILENFTLKDNYFGFYNSEAENQCVGWMSNMINPTVLEIQRAGDSSKITFRYPVAGNIIALGVLPSFPTNLVGGVPFPFVIGTQDMYIKWRANEALLTFRELETIKKR